MYNPYNWYWAAADGRVFSSAAQQIVPATDATYRAWSEANTATAWPCDDAGAQSDTALDAVLATYGLSTGSVASLIAYAEAKQLVVLAAMAISYTLKDGSATLTTRCDPGSLTFLNALAAWASLNAMSSPAPTRVFYNLDGSAATLGPADMAEFLTFVGSRVQATFDAVAQVRSAIVASPPSVTSMTAIDAFTWPIS